MKVFSKRYEKALREKKIKLSIPLTIRQRFWYAVNDLDSIKYVTNDLGYTRIDSSVLRELEGYLKRKYGVENLTAYVAEGKRGPVSLAQFILTCYPSQVFDVVEGFYDSSDVETRNGIQNEINNILEEEDFPWRLLEGEFLLIDSDFFTTRITEETLDLLKRKGFEGPIEEFLKAREDLSGGDYKGAIHNACNSFESVLKTILGGNDRNANLLIRDLMGTPLFGDIPENAQKAFGPSVLMALPFIRNKLGGHGQGPDKTEITKPYADLAVNLAGVLISFIVNKYLSEEEKGPEDEIPLFSF